MSLPIGWTCSRLDQVAKTATGGTPLRSNPEYFTGSIPWVKSGELEDNIITDTQEHLTEEAIQCSSAKVFPRGTLLVALYGATVGKTAILNTHAAINQAICAIFVDETVLDCGYVRYFLMHIRPDLLGKRYGGAQPNISQTVVRSTNIVYPPLGEQRQIARVLSAVQRAIERQERLIALTAELKKALMQKLFTEGTRGEPLKQTEIRPVPETWEIVRLDQIATIERGKFAHRPRNAPEFYGGSIPFVQTGDVSQCDGRIRRYTQTLNERGVAISRMFPCGTVLITIAANIRYTGILEFDSACTDSLVAITPTRGDSAEFLNHYLQTQQPIMDRMAPQGTQKNINIQFLRPWPVLRPSKEEQSVIADVLNTVDEKRRRHQQMRDALQLLFRTLLHQLMTAQIRVHDLDLSALDEPAVKAAGAT